MENTKKIETKKVLNNSNNVNKIWYLSVLNIFEALKLLVNIIEYLKKLIKGDSKLTSFISENFIQIKMLSNVKLRETLAIFFTTKINTKQITINNF